MEVKNDILWLLLLWLLRPHVSCDGRVMTVRRSIFWAVDFEMVERFEVGSSKWRAWVHENERFEYRGPEGYCVFRKEFVKGIGYWRAYKWHTRRLTGDRVYVGKIADMKPSAIQAKVWELSEQAGQRRRRYEAERERARRFRESRRRRWRRSRQLEKERQRQYRGREW